MNQEEAKMTRRQLQALETKDRLYHTALRVINEKGFNSVSIEDITKAANVAKGTFYTYFESKEALVFYTFEQSDAYYEQALEQVRGQDFLHMAEDFVRVSYTEYEKRGKGIIKAVISSYFAPPERSFYGDDRALLRCLRQIVAVGLREGSLDQSLPESHYVDLLLSAMIGAEVLWCFDRGSESLADLVEHAVRTTALGMLQKQ